MYLSCAEYTVINIVWNDYEDVGQLLVLLAPWPSNWSQEDQCSPKKGCTQRGCVSYSFSPQPVLGIWQAASRGCWELSAWGVTYDAQLISSILHAQNKLEGFQLHSSHALPQCQLSAARGIWWFCSLHVSGYPHIGRCVFILVTAQRGLLHASFCEDLISYEAMKLILRRFIGE